MKEDKKSLIYLVGSGVITLFSFCLCIIFGIMNFWNLSFCASIFTLISQIVFAFLLAKRSKRND